MAPRSRYHSIRASSRWQTPPPHELGLARLRLLRLRAKRSPTRSSCPRRAWRPRSMHRTSPCQILAAPPARRRRSGNACGSRATCRRTCGSARRHCRCCASSPEAPLGLLADDNGNRERRLRAVSRDCRRGCRLIARHHADLGCAGQGRCCQARRWPNGGNMNVVCFDQPVRLLARATTVALTIPRRRRRDGIVCISLRCRTSTVRFDLDVGLVLRATEPSCDANAWRAQGPLVRTSGSRDTGRQPSTRFDVAPVGLPSPRAAIELAGTRATPVRAPARLRGRRAHRATPRGRTSESRGSATTAASHSNGSLQSDVVGAMLAVALNGWCETRDQRDLRRALLRVLTLLEAR